MARTREDVAPALSRHGFEEASPHADPGSAPPTDDEPAEADPSVPEAPAGPTDPPADPDEPLNPA